MNINNYDYIVVSFSGGKDSVACFLHLLELGVDISKVELWHNNVDGEGFNFFDWPITESYCETFAEAFNIPIYFSWRDGGINREMHRLDQTTAGVYFQEPTGNPGEMRTRYLPPDKRAKKNTRMLFPQVSANLSVRWCSAAAKIDVASRAMNNQERFKGKRTLFITGERAQESTARANYKTEEPHRCNVKSRHVDAWRPIHKWKEEQVWDLFEKYKVRPHPAYELGFGRVSCMNCIFSSKNQIASVKELDPVRFEWVCKKEEQFGKTIHRSKSWREQVTKGTSYDAIAKNPDIAELAMSEEYSESIIVDKWVLPAGAFGESTGPT
jgi:3'-phosphoadenosine 5'-phosphosulfate sulfotransferase (PAPS reductase)/FAD synthetase